MTYAVDYANVDGDAPPNFWETIKAGATIVGIRGAWGYHGATTTDTTLERDAGAARDAGCQVFGYLFLDYATDVTAQVTALASSYKRQPKDLPVALDLEMDAPPPNTTPQSRVAMAEDALAQLQAVYGKLGVMVYTSADQWVDHFGDADSDALAAVPLWIKTPYQWKPRNPPKLASIGPLGDLPKPWRQPGSPGAMLQQFQGDAIGFPGFSSTVDISKFLVPTVGDPRWTWINGQAAKYGSFTAWQAAMGLQVDNIFGPHSLAAMCK